MKEKNTWGWTIGIIVVLFIIAGLWWWMAYPSMQGGVANSTNTTPTPSTTNTAPAGTEPTAVSVIDNSNESVATIVAGLTGSSEYASYFNSTGVGATLGAGPYTVFVSDDAGYALLKPGTITSLNATQLKRLIQYSIVSGKALNVSTQENGSVKALSGDELNFKADTNGVVQVNSSFALAAYKASNGIVYVIDQPLIPPTSGNIMTP